MRVFAPGRSCGRRLAVNSLYPNQKFWFGIPLQGEWIDVPDYFNQVTRGQPCNTVVHAKMVDPDGFNYTKWDQTVVTGGETLPYVQSNSPDYSRWSSGNAPYRYLCISPYEVLSDTVRIDPSKKYKGKKPKRKPYTRTVYTRKEYSVCVEVCPSARTLYESKWKKYAVLCDGSFHVFATKDEVVSESAPSAQWVGRSFGFGFNWVDGYPVYYPSGSAATVPWCWDIANLLTQANHGTRNYFTGSKQEAAEYFANRVEEIILNHGVSLATLAREDPNYGSNYWSILPCGLGPLPTMNFRSAFLMSEDYIIGEGLDPLLAPNRMANHWLESMKEHALLEACESLPRLSDNSIQNLTEIVGFIKALVVDHQIEIPKSLADAWLAYRYSYGTAKMDAQDAIKFVHRRMDLGTLDRMIVGRGVATHTFSDGTTATLRCQVEVRPKNVDLLDKLWRALDTYGLTPDFYVIWDSIPYSFMVDWFLPIGDIAGVWDANAMYFSGRYYELSGLVYSVTYTRELDGVPVKCYTRWAGSVPSSLNAYYWFDSPSTSVKTVVKRILDAGSIFIG